MADHGPQVTALTCANCAQRQRVTIRHVGDAVVMPLCWACGPTTWLNLPLLDPAPYPPERGPMQRWIDWVYGWSDIDPSGFHETG
jgi:hypothetical protein